MVIKTMPLTHEIITEARAFAKTVYSRKLQRPDKFETGTEKSSDFLGFLFEFAVCDFYGLARPKLLQGKQLDDYDILLAGMRIDVKHSKACLINREQFERKKGKIDAFLFGNTTLLCYETKALFADIFGWIEYAQVSKKGTLVDFSNGSQAYKIRKGVLRCPLELRKTQGDLNAKRKNGKHSSDVKPKTRV